MGPLPIAFTIDSFVCDSCVSYLYPTGFTMVSEPLIEDRLVWFSTACELLIGPVNLLYGSPGNGLELNAVIICERFFFENPSKF